MVAGQQPTNLGTCWVRYPFIRLANKLRTGIAEMPIDLIAGSAHLELAMFLVSQAKLTSSVADDFGSTRGNRDNLI